MENFDSELEKRVWKRVRGEEQPAPMGLKGLMAAEQNEAAVYLMLARQMQGKEKNVLRRMFEQEQMHATCLRGMHMVMTGQPLAVRTPPVTPQTPEIALRKCYGRKLRTMAEYENRTNDREYGAVFAQLAQQEREHCLQLLEILGNLRR